MGIFKDKFIVSLLKEILADVYQFHDDNIDYERFGSSSKDKSLIETYEMIKEKISKVLYRKQDVFKNYLPINNGKNNIDEFSGKFEDFAELHSLLADQNSKELLIKIVAFRILGGDHVKLPLNTSDYWKKREYAKTLINSKETISVNFMNWSLSYFKLDKIGYPINMFLTPAAICHRFMIKSYEYYSDETYIKADKGDVVIDAGACWGDSSLYFAHEIGENGRVFAFEFIPENLNILQRNININPQLQGRIHIIKNPVWDKSGEVLFFNDNGPGSTVSSDKMTTDCIPVSTISIDDFVEENCLKKVDFIKMDIEGAELNALNGAVNTIKRFQPKLAISIYHKLSDFTLIPSFLTSLDLDYEYFLGHYSIHSEETVLFAKKRNKGKEDLS